MEKCEEKSQLLAGPRQKVYNGFTHGPLIPPPPRTLARHGSTIIEPVIFLFLMAKALSDNVITNLLEYHTCRMELSLPDSNCSEPIAPAIEGLIQPTTASVIMGRSLLEAAVPSCLAVLVGPWSDANGRKPFLVIALTGMAATYLCWGVLALNPKLHPQMFLLATLPQSLSGGTIVVVMLIMCYVSDVTDHETRSFRMAMMTLFIYVSFVFGTAAAPVLISLQDSLNPYPLIFFITALIMMLNVLYAHWFIQESVTLYPHRNREFFHLSLVNDFFSVCFKKRNNYGRVMTLLVISTLTVNIFLVDGESAIVYLSLRALFSWQLEEYSLYCSFHSIINGLGAVAGVWLFVTVLGLPSMFVAALVLATRCARSILIALARSGSDFYLAAVIAFFSTAFIPICRTELSTLVPKEDLGKVFALAAFLETVTPMAATPLYTYVYQLTFLQTPSVVYWLSVALSAASVLMVLVVFVLQKMVRGSCYVCETPKQERYERC